MSDYTWENVLVTGDANVASYERTFDELVIRLVLWDESSREVKATGVTVSHDVGTWECDAIVRYPDFDDDEGRTGYAVINTDSEATLTFAAEQLDLGEPAT